MSRNKDRFGANKAPVSDAPPIFNPLNFVAPTEFVDIPSDGVGYPDGHPLRGEGVVEIKFMTAKEEDILTSATLIKKGVAIDRFLKSIIVDDNINPDTLLVADKNAILVAARISGYGPDYEAELQCPKCTTTNVLNFNLGASKGIAGFVPSDSGIEQLENGNFKLKLPYCGFNVEVGLLTALDEKRLTQLVMSQVEAEEDTNLVSAQYKKMIKSIEGHAEEEVINAFVENMPTIDSRQLKMIYKNINPSFEIKDKFVCASCKHKEEVDVPIGTNFFWPDR